MRSSKWLMTIFVLILARNVLAADLNESKTYAKGLIADTVKMLKTAGYPITALHFIDIDQRYSTASNHVGEFRIILNSQRPITVRVPVVIGNEPIPQARFEERFLIKATVEIETRVLIPHGDGKLSNVMKALRLDLSTVRTKLQQLRIEIKSKPGAYTRALLVDHGPRVAQALNSLSNLAYGHEQPYSKINMQLEGESITLDTLKERLGVLEGVLETAKDREKGAKENVARYEPGHPEYETARAQYTEAASNASKVSQTLTMLKHNIFLVELLKDPEAEKAREARMLDNHEERVDLTVRELNVLDRQMELKNQKVIMEIDVRLDTHRQNLINLMDVIEHFRSQGIHVLGSTRILSHGAELHNMDEHLSEAIKLRSVDALTRVIKRGEVIGVGILTTIANLELELDALKRTETLKAKPTGLSGAVLSNTGITAAAINEELKILRDQFEIFEGMTKEAMEARMKFGKK